MILLLPLLTSSVIRKSEDENIETKVWEYLKKYSENSYYILKKYDEAPQQYSFGNTTITLGEKTNFLIYVTGDSDKDIIKSLNTLVHEMCHAFTSTLVYQYLQEQNIENFNFDDHYFLFYVDNQKSILVPRTKVFRTNEIHESIPEKLQTMRYKIYIYPSSEIGSQIDGIYGLLNELNAYYHGTRTTLDFLDYYSKIAHDNPMHWLEFFSDVNGTYFAHLEFKFYILKYLLFARDHYPEIYQGILANDQFIKAFKIIDSNYSELIKKYFKIKSEILQDLQNKGIESSEDEEYIFVENRGCGNFLGTYKKFEDELNQPEYLSILTALEKAAESK